jgi:aryl-alcohol dehydrogenase-like predicted oxidoreductase
MRQAVDASLKRLGTDYIDLYWVDIWDQITPVEEIMRGLDDLVREGKVLYVGISDAPAWWIVQANTLAQLRGWAPFIGLQIEYSLIERTVERELIPMARALNLGLTAWSPLSNGVLTGKYHGQGSSEQIHRQANPRYRWQQGNRRRHRESPATRRRRSARRRKEHSCGLRSPTVHSS